MVCVCIPIPAPTCPVDVAVLPLSAEDRAFILGAEPDLWATAEKHAGAVGFASVRVHTDFTIVTTQISFYMQVFFLTFLSVSFILYWKLPC